MSFPSFVPIRTPRAAAQRATNVLYGRDVPMNETSSESEDTLSETSSGNVSEISDAVIDEEEEESGHSSAEDFPSTETSSEYHQQTLVSKDGKEIWSTQPVNSLIGKTNRQNILIENAGPTRRMIKSLGSPMSAFLAFITDEMLSKICKYTNMEGRKLLNENFSEVSVKELQQYIGLVLLAGVYRGNKEPINHLWNEISGRIVFSKTMPRNRFTTITRFLRFDDKETRPGRRERDKLAPIREFANTFLAKCKTNYKPSANLCVDEQLVVFKGRCPFKVYIPSKPGKYGIKIWVCADVQNSYCCTFDIYAGQIGRTPEIGQGERVVLQLVEPYYGSGRNITADNFFSSLQLTRSLLSKRLSYVGTLRKNKPFLPPEFQKFHLRQQFSSIFGYQKDVTIVNYIPKPRKNVVLISSLHYEGLLSEREDAKPEIIMAYNATKGGVDTLDQLVRTYSSIRKSRRWPLTLFFNFVDIAAYNAFVCYLFVHPHYHARKSHKRRLFLEELGLSLVELPQPQIALRSPLAGISCNCIMSFCF